ncbi:MAG: phosphoribosylaminoimidazolesuccinocarboxamide synthase [Armatimonadota bacterium]|nr:phosphoribosylaminoimidazolesuccinocarboxamide synthase [Armatimonadota bacterium]MDR7452476.1 phosphoribosylaminoimidazolesuccinocarboxamide synthase [Armatimonadota bacterium]MDR7467328.1 phosphoribosylaminoimidazolesuccinocarboxamide synthase [Armatimonadota bacterium]MDR7494099.1 phosphoribosylaminoimidazolesuccinocarboxamide synthase [Armatimonadota bacterium]MDR7498934.1 phosphoribosylaminoimidazolesuccinocarboxamide synthase [Armatimonadota bacterium]
MTTAATLTESRLPLPLHTRGKVRDVYAAEDRLLIVATDRLSAFDHVLPTPIPDKGRVLTQLSAFWFTKTADLVRNHLLTVRPEEIVRQLPALQAVPRDLLDGRVMLVERCARIDVECVVRGYLTGSALEEYARDGTVAGVPLPPGLRNGDRLPEPVFTPATKAAVGHDETITFAALQEVVGRELADALRTISLSLYRRAANHAAARGLILADTKFEFGMRDGEVVLIDEALTPDSSRYWDAAHYPGALVAFDKQVVRDYLTRIGWNREPPAPALPADVVAATRARYLETYTRLTGQSLPERTTTEEA